MHSSTSRSAPLTRITNLNTCMLLKVKKALVIEDDPFSQKMFYKIITDKLKNVEVYFTNNYDQAVQLLHAIDHFDLVVLDVYLGEGRNGVDIYLSIVNGLHHSTVLMTSALEKEDYIGLFPKNVPIPPYIKKPFDPNSCGLLIEALIEEHML